MALTYTQAGVDIDRADSLIDRIKPLARSTRTPFVVDDVGGFAGLCGLPGDIDDPVLVSGTDGVGTKLKVAFATGVHDTIGQDLVAMCVNDIICCGARPLFFLDYFGCGKLEVDTAEQVVKGVADGCKIAGCALLGGETAELPGMYADGEYDLAGFAVGVVSERAILGSQRVKVGDELVAVGSSGLHSNGYSLARRALLEEGGYKLEQQVPGLGKTLAAELLTPTRIYAKSAQHLASRLGTDLHALCHITGGGVVDNLPRILSEGQAAKLRLDHPRPEVFELIQKAGPVEETEMRRTFNLGIGLVAVVEGGQSAAACAALSEQGETCWPLGEVVTQPGAPHVIVEGS